MSHGAFILGIFANIFLVTLPQHTRADDATDEQRIVAAFNESAFKLYTALKTDGKNLVISPSSIGLAMSMTRSGARGETEAEMAKALAHSLSSQRVDELSRKLLEKLERDDKVSLKIANALCLTKEGFLVDPSFKKHLSERYLAELFTSMDVDPINQWVSRKTGGQIPKILDRLSDRSLCVLLNTVAFKGLWQKPFNPSIPGEPQRKLAFHVEPNRSIELEMMRKRRSMPIHKEEEFSAVGLYYQDTSLVLALVLPAKRDGLRDVESPTAIGKVVAFFKSIKELNSKFPDTADAGYQDIELFVPRFKVASDFDLIPPFQTCGMKRAFDMQLSEFQGIVRNAGQGMVWLSQIRHRAQLEIDERGTVATAATAVESEFRSIPRRMVFDRPFLFLLVDRNTGAIHFLGRVVNPSEQVP